MHARSIAPLALDSYQRAARVVLANHLVTRTFPDRIALPLIRRWATELREDLAELFGYRLEVTETTARLFPVIDRLDAGRPARTPAERVFDRRRYAYLALALASLGRAGDQITLSELADQVAAYATRVDGLELSTERAADRDAFVDAVAWLSTRGALTLADGDAGGWAADPEAGEALYDIDRSVVFAIFRPPRALQHLQSVHGLLADGGSDSGATVSVAQTRAAAARRVRRALVELPVVYAEELAADEQILLGSEKLVAEVELLTGLRAERRAEGVALIDTSGRLSDVRFPGTGTLAQVALLLVGEIADRVLDIDNPVPRRPLPAAPTELADRLDAAIPAATVFEPLAMAVETVADDDDSLGDGPQPQVPEHPFLTWTWIRETVQALTDRYGSTFAAQWQADVPALTTEAVGLLQRLRLVRAVGPAEGTSGPPTAKTGKSVLDQNSQPSAGAAASTGGTPPAGAAGSTADTPPTGAAGSTADTPPTGAAASTADTPRTEAAASTGGTPQTGAAADTATAETRAAGDADTSGGGPHSGDTARPPADEAGLLILPALARYRGAIVTVRTRAQSELFASATKLGEHADAGGRS